MKRKEHTPFYFNEEVDRALKECDGARALAKQREWELKHKGG